MIVMGMMLTARPILNDYDDALVIHAETIILYFDWTVDRVLMDVEVSSSLVVCIHIRSDFYSEFPSTASSSSSFASGPNEHHRFNFSLVKTDSNGFWLR